MSLVARAVEAAGIPTVMVGVLRGALEELPAPRNVLVRYRLGQVFGEPGRRAQQLAVLRDVLAAVETIGEPGGLVVLPYRWKRDDFPAAPR